MLLEGREEKNRSVMTKGEMPRRTTNTSPKRRRSPSWKEAKSKVRDRIMGYLEEGAMKRGHLPIGVYPDGRTWKHGSPRRYRKRSPSAKDKLMGYLEESAAKRGMLPVVYYPDGRTWKHGRSAASR